jgi:hypothetical protein
VNDFNSRIALLDKQQLSDKVAKELRRASKTGNQPAVRSDLTILPKGRTEWVMTDLTLYES